MMNQDLSILDWLEEVPEALLLVTPRGEVVHVNERARTTLSLDLSELTLLHDLFDQLDSEREQLSLLRALVRLRPGQESRLLLRYRPEPERTFYISLKHSRRGDYVLVSLREEIDLLESFEPVRDELDRYQMLVRNLPKSAVILFDRDLRYLVVDGPAIKEAGFEPEAFLGKTLQEVLPESVETLEPLYRAALAGEELDSMIYSAQGGVYETAVLPVCDGDGAVRAGMLFAVDVTEAHAQRARLELQEHSLTLYAQQMSALAGVLRRREEFAAIAQVIDVPQLPLALKPEPIAMREALQRAWVEAAMPSYVVPWFNSGGSEQEALRMNPAAFEQVLREVFYFLGQSLAPQREERLTLEIDHGVELTLLTLRFTHQEPALTRQTLPQSAETFLRRIDEASPLTLGLMRLRHLALGCGGSLHTAHTSARSRLVLTLPIA